MKIDVKKVAKLANLPLTTAEEKKFETQLEETISYIQSLDEIDTKGVSPTSQVTGLVNVLREDTITPSLTQEEALKNAQSTHNGFFKVKAILEQN
ncbi:MAG: Asp-tRNA(Asn)/Glu-tRNA(Gln) amidotransferase subunit GatC [Candidatus Levybacteria bacterium]|nr:Asp-tRNA(Asn)/Glu-tRNA(Gln) amidotransferase subunit GatC [Candidatus Levybacteria bacterium]MBP9815465.1 Asp-tRNA(Asn)/Glu-tRNA(Gln) amidotransferase subunit GatC [Candidatus Levybacteria bacterium]